MPELLQHVGAAGGRRARRRSTIGGKTPVVDVEDGIENTTSGPAVRFTVESAKRPTAPDSRAEELGTVGVAMVEGEPATAPVHRQRPAVPAARALPGVGARVARGDEQHDARELDGRHGHARRRSTTIDELPGQTEIRRENLQRLVEVTARLEGVDMGTGIAAVQKAVADLKLPPSIRVEYGGTYQEQQKSFRDLAIVLVLAVVLIFLVLLFEFRSFTPPVAILSSAILSTSGVFFALLITRTTFNVSSFMGLIMVIGIVAKNGILLLDANEKFRVDRILAGGGDHSGRTAPAAADRDDGAGGGGRHAAAGARARRRIADAAAAGHRGHRRHPDLDGAVAHHHAGDSVSYLEAPLASGPSPDSRRHYNS